MKSYVGSKLVVAYLQTNVEFKFNYPRRDQPGPEEETKGCVVDYGDYVSWCPQEEFERVSRSVNIYHNTFILNRWLMTRIINAELATAVTVGDGPEEEGYNIYYPDGHISWSPKDVFENAYREISDEEADLIMDAESNSLYPKLDAAIKKADESPDSMNVLPEEGEEKPYTLKNEFRDVDTSTTAPSSGTPIRSTPSTLSKKKRPYTRQKKTLPDKPVKDDLGLSNKGY